MNRTIPLISKTT